MRTEKTIKKITKSDARACQQYSLQTNIYGLHAIRDALTDLIQSFRAAHPDEYRRGGLYEVVNSLSSPFAKSRLNAAIDLKEELSEYIMTVKEAEK